MTLYVRKITQAKWLQTKILDGEDPSADAITNCIKTKNNTLSVWTIAAEADLDQAVLAIVAAGENLDSIDVVIFSEQRIDELGISHTQTDGFTPVTSLVKTHIDLENLNYTSLGQVANCVTEAFRTNKVKRYTKAMLKNVLENAINSGILQLNSLNDSLKAKLS